MLVRLSDSDAGLVALVGGKASRLAVAAVAGFPVPDGFVVAVGDEVSDAKLTEAAASLAPRVAVRSSAMAEDLAGASFAGLYETFLNVPPGQVPESVRRCRATADADRVRGYRSSRSDHGVAVLVQAMVPAQCAGVAFTADPLTGSTDAVGRDGGARTGGPSGGRRRFRRGMAGHRWDRDTNQYGPTNGPGPCAHR